MLRVMFFIQHLVMDVRLFTSTAITLVILAELSTVLMEGTINIQITVCLLFFAIVFCTHPHVPL